jgi:hypothetical protein
MRLKECVVWCNCEQGTMFKTSLKKEGTKNNVLFILTEDERIYFQGYCSGCGQSIDWSTSIIDLLFSCPKAREEH